MYDAVYVYAHALRKAGGDIFAEMLSCSEEKKWTFGAQISTLMKEVNKIHLSNYIKSYFS